MKTPLLFAIALLLCISGLSQNVGIGITNPQFPLSFPGSLGDKISLWTDGTATHYGIGIQSGLFQVFSKTSADNIVFGHGNSNSFTERMRIINFGDLGMDLKGRIMLRNGTSPPDFNLGPGIWLYKADNSGLLGFMGTQNNQNFGFYGGPAGWGFLYDAINSRVGIGTAPSSISILEVTGNLNITGNFDNTRTSPGGAGVFGNCINGSSGIGVYGNGSEAGVYGQANVTGPGARFGVEGFGSNGTSYNYGVFGVGTNGTNAFGVYGSATGGTVSTWAGYFNGTVYANTYSTSDRKLKLDIKPLTGAMSIINQLNPSFYTFKTNEYKQMHLPEGVHYGLVADEVQQVMPGVVKKAVHPAQYENHNEHTGKKLSDEVEFNTINYTEMIPILIGAVKEQQQMILQLQKEIEELKRKIK